MLLAQLSWHDRVNAERRLAGELAAARRELDRIVRLAELDQLLDVEDCWELRMAASRVETIAREVLFDVRDRLARRAR